MQDGAYWRKNSASLYFPPSPSPSTATTALSIPDLCPLPPSGPCPPGHCAKTRAPTKWAANKCWHSFLSFTALWSALGDFTLWLCDNVNDQLSLVATSKRSRLQRTFSEGTPLINKEIAIHNQIFVRLDWPSPPLQVCLLLFYILFQGWKCVQSFQNKNWQKSVWSWCLCQLEMCPRAVADHFARKPSPAGSRLWTQLAKLISSMHITGHRQWPLPTVSTANIFKLTVHSVNHKLLCKPTVFNICTIKCAICAPSQPSASVYSVHSVYIILRSSAKWKLLTSPEQTHSWRSCLWKIG